MDTSVKERVKVTTDFWRVEFDLRSGGALDTTVFPRGSGKNLLMKPCRAHVDELSDWNVAETAAPGTPACGAPSHRVRARSPTRARTRTRRARRWPK